MELEDMSMAEVVEYEGYQIIPVEGRAGGIAGYTILGKDAEGNNVVHQRGLASVFKAQAKIDRIVSGEDRGVRT